MSKVRSDKFGRYVRTNGNVYRPIATQSTGTGYSIGINLVMDEDKTVFNVDDKVKASHWIGTPLAKVTNGSIVEYWSSHGCYYEKGKTIPTERCWQGRYVPPKKNKKTDKFLANIGVQPRGVR